jgi:hypothetical protein
MLLANGAVCFYNKFVIECKVEDEDDEDNTQCKTYCLARRLQKEPERISPENM